MEATPPALLIIDVQAAIDHPSWGRRNNPQAEANIVRLLSGWRDLGWPVVHVRHASTDPASTYRPDGPGYAFKPEVAPRAGERVVTKNYTCAFVGTDLEADLRADGISRLVITGVITNNSVEATARLAGDLGFATVVVSDATATFDKRDLGGTLYPAETVHALSLANLQGEYAEVLTTETVLESLPKALHHG